MYVTVAGPRGGVVREEETLFSFASRCADIPVSYTHLTLPTKA